MIPATLLSDLRRATTGKARENNLSGQPFRVPARASDSISLELDARIDLEADHRLAHCRRTQESRVAEYGTLLQTATRLSSRVDGISLNQRGRESFMLDHRFQMTVLPRHLATFRDQLRQLFVIPYGVACFIERVTRHACLLASLGELIPEPVLNPLARLR